MKFDEDWIIKTKLSNENIQKLLLDIDLTIIENNLTSNIRGKSSFGNIKQYELDEYLNPEIKVIEKVIKNCLIKSKIISFDNEIKNISKWTVIGEEGSYHVTHKHNLLNSNVKSAISTVTYLKVPEKLNNDPSGKFYAFLRSNELITISPKVGDIFIFPVWIYHGTYPQSKGTRQTLNLDFKFR